MTETEEQQLLARAVKGDVPSFNRLVIIYQQSIYNLALRMLGDAEEAADVSQETFLSAYRGLKSYRGGSWKSWLYRIATNACYDQLRSRKRRPQSPLDEKSDTVEMLSRPSTLAHREEPEEYALNRELGGEIQAGLDLLPEDQRAALILCDVQGMSYEEIAAVMNTSTGTVRSRISRGRAKMRDYLLARGELLPQSRRQ